MSGKLKDRRIAALLALMSAIPMLPSGLHKFYLGQMQWGVLYLLLSLTPIPRVASALEGLWYLFQDKEEFNRNFNALMSQSPSETLPIEPTRVTVIADALRQLDQLRQDGLLSEYEFEQKRRQLLDRIG